MIAVVAEERVAVVEPVVQVQTPGDIPVMPVQPVVELTVVRLRRSQRINDQDMREHGQHFPARLMNGEKQQVILRVRGARVSVTWNGESRMTRDLTGRRFNSTVLWGDGRGNRVVRVEEPDGVSLHRVSGHAEGVSYGALAG